MWALFKKILLLVLNVTMISRHRRLNVYKRFPVIKAYFYKAFQDNLNTAEWIKNIKNILELHDQGNLIQNAFKIIEWN